ncbi:MAG: class III poly(R)-hydroxyalkanoic acid synthase subunit PhaE [Pseudomonadota bacterium]
MADTQNAWMENWLNSQQQYWKAWSDMAQSGMKMPEAARTPWTQGLDQWWKSVADLTPPDGRAMFDKLMDASKGYFAMAEKFAGGGKQSGLDTLNGLMEQTRKTWQDWLNGAAAKPPKDMMAFWDLPLDTWQRFAAGVMPMPGDFTQAFHPDGSQRAMDAMRGEVNRFLSIPAVGYARESQEQVQTLARLMADYGAAVQAYQTAFGTLAMDTAREFQATVQAMAEQGEKLDSLRAIYDKWVELSEAAYARFVMSQEYQALYGRLVNSLMAVKQHSARMVDQTLEALHMPTHAEIDTLQRRQHELRRDNLALRKETKALRSELNSLRELVEGLAQAATKPVTPAKAPVAASPAASIEEEAKPPVRRPAPRKPATGQPVKSAAAKPAAKPATAAKPAVRKTK